MLEMYPRPKAKPGGCNFSALLVLACLLDALAAHVYHPSRSIRRRLKYKTKVKGRPGVRFRRIEKLVLNKMEWLATWFLTKATFVQFLYYEFRNPLTHEAGRDPKRRVKARPRGWTASRITMWGTVEPVDIDQVDGWTSWPEAWPIMEPYKVLVRTKTGKPFHYRLTVVALYWAVKEVVRKLSA